MNENSVLKIEMITEKKSDFESESLSFNSKLSITSSVSVLYVEISIEFSLKVREVNVGTFVSKADTM